MMLSQPFNNYNSGNEAITITTILEWEHDDCSDWECCSCSWYNDETTMICGGCGDERDLDVHPIPGTSAPRPVHDEMFRVFKRSEFVNLLSQSEWRNG